MSAVANPKNTYNPRGDAAKLLSYRPNGAVITDDDGAFLAVRPIILNQNSFDADDNFVADDHTIAYLRKIESETIAILSEADSIKNNQKSIDFANDAFIARVAPLVDRIRFAALNHDCYVSDTAVLFVNSIDAAPHVIVHPLTTAGGIDLTTMSKYIDPSDPS